MKLALDLHIHSGLSPCADREMTPNNIINMAMLKGLDAIAICDHNSLLNIEVFSKIAKKKGILFIPGVEITTKEEVHLLAYFKNVESAYNFQRIIDEFLPKEKNNKSLFGYQHIYNEKDEVVKEVDVLLSNSLRLTLEDAISEIRKLGGLAVPAHINRNRYSIISNLGFVDPNLKVNAIEICRQSNLKLLEKFCTNIEKYKIIYSSDAHTLGQILEREFFIEVQDYTVRSILESLDFSTDRR